MKPGPNGNRGNEVKKDKLIALVSELSNLEGAPGFEENVCRYISETAERLSLGNTQKDPMHNLYLERAGNQTALDEKETGREPSEAIRVQLDAHMDEVAFMVQAVLPNGTLKMIPLGGWVDSNIPAHMVKVRTSDGSFLRGVTTSKPPHFMTAEERAKPISLDQIVVDLGFSSKSETLDAGVKPGAPIIPDVSCFYLEEQDRFFGKAFDCRSGCAAILAVLDELKEERLSCDVVAAFSTQEEVGTRGASVTSARVKPDLALVFEGCPADDTFGDPELSQTKIGHGPMLRHIDARMITHPGFQRYALQLAEELGIPVQTAVRTGGSTNGAPIHLSAQAVPTIVIGIPVRYIHTHYGICSYRDHEAAIRLASAILTRMDRSCFRSLYH